MTTVLALTVVCDDCGHLDVCTTEQLHLLAFAELHFTNLGWQMDKEPTHNLCPACVALNTKE